MRSAVVLVVFAAPVALLQGLPIVPAAAQETKGKDTATQSGQKPASLAEIGPKPEPAKRPEPAAIEEAIRRGVGFLVGNQSKDGSWGSPELKGGVEIYTDIPGGFRAYHCAVTALCVSALIETGGDSEAVKKAIERGENWILEYLPKLRRDSPGVLYCIWAHAYGIQALVRMHDRLPDQERREKIKKIISQQIDMLKRFESVDKGWGYYDDRTSSQRPGTDSTSFMTAAVLVALREAKDIG